MADTPSPSGLERPARQRGLLAPWDTEAARAASAKSALKAKERSDKAQNTIRTRENAYKALVAALPKAIQALINRALENPDGAAMGRLLERALPLLQDQGAGRKVLEGLTLEISRDGVKLQLPAAQQVASLEPVDVQTEPLSNSLSSKGLSAPSLPSVEQQAP